jgi:4-amino-4-deoxy-L-arabinose transferase-like glycosyltransferase
MWLRFRDGFIAGYVLDENVKLFATNRFNTRFDLWFYFRVLAAGLLPWTGLVIGRLYDNVRTLIRRQPLDSVEVLLWCWTFAIVAFFTASRFKLDHYVFPAAPALCLLCARAWVDVRQRTLNRQSAGARIGFHMVGPILVVVGSGGGYFMIARLDLPAAAMVVPLVMLLAGAVITARASLGNWQAPKVPWLTLAACVTMYVGIILWVMPALEQRKVVPDVARWVSSHAPGDARVALYRLNRWSNTFRFYVDRHTPHLESAAEARAFFNEPEPFYCVMTGQIFDEFAAQGVPLQAVYEREGMWVTSGRALWRRRLPATRFVIATRRPEAVHHKIDP